MGQTTLNIHPSAGSGGPTPPPHKDLYAKREQIYPKLAHGNFRLVKWVVMAVTLGVYYLLPWIRWDRGEGIPNQAVLADFEVDIMDVGQAVIHDHLTLGFLVSVPSASESLFREPRRQSRI